MNKMPCLHCKKRAPRQVDPDHIAKQRSILSKALRPDNSEDLHYDAHLVLRHTKRNVVLLNLQKVLLGSVVGSYVIWMLWNWFGMGAEDLVLKLSEEPLNFGTSNYMGPASIFCVDASIASWRIKSVHAVLPGSNGKKRVRVNLSSTVKHFSRPLFPSQEGNLSSYKTMCKDAHLDLEQRAAMQSEGDEDEYDYYDSADDENYYSNDSDENEYFDSNDKQDSDSSAGLTPTASCFDCYIVPGQEIRSIQQSLTMQFDAIFSRDRPGYWAFFDSSLLDDMAKLDQYLFSKENPQIGNHVFYKCAATQVDYQFSSEEHPEPVDPQAGTVSHTFVISSLSSIHRESCVSANMSDPTFSFKPDVRGMRIRRVFHLPRVDLLDLLSKIGGMSISIKGVITIFITFCIAHFAPMAKDKKFLEKLNEHLHFVDQNEIKRDNSGNELDMKVDGASHSAKTKSGASDLLKDKKLLEDVTQYEEELFCLDQRARGLRTNIQDAEQELQNVLAQVQDVKARWGKTTLRV